MTNTTIENNEPYTLEELAELNEFEYNDAATDDFDETVAKGSPFLHVDNIERTYHSLSYALTRVDTVLVKQAEDPNITPFHYRKSVMFRRRVLWALSVLEGHPNWPAREAQGQKQWRAFAHELADLLEGTALDRKLDEVRLPDKLGGMTVRDWVARRRVKDPARVPAKEMVIAA